MSYRATQCPECKSYQCSLTKNGLEQKACGTKIIIEAETICENGHIFMNSILSAYGEQQKSRGGII